MKNKFLQKAKSILNEMRNLENSPRHVVDVFHNETVHHNIHVPISKEIKNLGFFVNKPKLKDGVAHYVINNNNRGSEILTNQLGIGKSLIPIPTHHPQQESSVRHLVTRAFSNKPSRYLNYLKTLHGSISNTIKEHKNQWQTSHVAATQSIRAIKQSTIDSIQNKKSIGDSVEHHQSQAHRHSETAAQHERIIKDLEHHRTLVAKHARALPKIFGLDSSEKSAGNLDSNRIVFDVWDEIL